jgi:hypothetical protein
MPTRANVLGHGTTRGQETLGLPWRLKPLHAPLPLAGGLMSMLRTVVEITVLTVPHPGQHLALRRPITLQLSRNDDARHVR